MERVAVTGGAGFLGSNLVKGLLKKGKEVSIIDNFSAGFAANLKDLDIDQECVEGDLRDYDFVDKALRDFDTVYHFAAEVGSVVYLHGSKARELAAMQNNVIMDTNVFKACAKNGVGKIIYASSVAVYPFDEQMGASVFFKEEDTERKVNPEGGYGWSKYIGERQLGFMSDISVGIARIFHAYGQNLYLPQDRSQVIASLIRKAIAYPKEEFIVWGDGSQKRCFVYIDDAMDAIFRLDDYVGRNGTLTVNIGSKDEVSVKELAETIVEVSGKGMQIKFDPSKPTGVMSRMSDLHRIERVLGLGWKPTTDFKTGIARTYEWAKKRLSEQ
jgi:nucleoside-diphosphate-sugar epimerase